MGRGLAVKNIFIEAKPFALGVRAEHPQELIDSIQYSCDFRGDYLPPAPYSIVKQVNGRGMYSFCMCPGGVIAPCATADGEVVAFSYDTFAVDGLSAAAIKKISTGSVFAGLDAVNKQPVRARAEIHAISSKEIGWGVGKPRNGLYLQLKQVHYLRDGKPIATGDTYFVEGKFQFIIHRTV